jgi:deoxyribose-phosphate aldolase
MDIRTILESVDHTLLSQTSTWEQIKKICDEGMEYQTASVCIPPSFVKRAKEYTGEKLSICTVIGFPNGYSTAETKVFETRDAIQNGADEIDMVINIGDLKDKNYDSIHSEIKSIKAVCGLKLLKVIIETCLLTDEEKVKMCQLVTEAGADYIKTSTGFSSGGATEEDIRMFTKNIGEGVKIKAAGGIRSLETAERLIEAGASRIGASSIIKQIIGENLKVK